MGGEEGVGSLSCWMGWDEGRDGGMGWDGMGVRRGAG